jgi:hypothetical protein
LKKEKSVGMISVETKQVRVVTLTIIWFWSLPFKY